ncbi:C45 family autoproteolytic acyltransferase/hydolase [Ornithinibacillus bavariensis]|uniref:C45 family autoproteolytic acyltransferase/hydolase n=1 Tax=Ornithinibacillus bavariensis TaxID=545502 RepID=UPI000EC0D645|nr:acyl-CoA--6-aminopenicillanic acid acyltransferase [Ornithinibacillus sp.]
MYQELKVDIKEVVGSNVDIGIKLGRETNKDESIAYMYKLNRDVDDNTAKALLQRYSPSLCNELLGLANGLGIDQDTALKIFSGYNTEIPSMGCSAIAKDDYYARNYDFSPKLYDACFIFHNATEGYASVGFSQQMIGRLDGMNEHGLVVGLHLVNEGYKGNGFLGTNIVRIVLDQCKDVTEATELLNRIPHGYCYNFSLMDKSGNKCIVEASPEKQVVKYLDTLQCTNHFESKHLKDKNRNYIKSSISRKKTLQELTKLHHDPAHIYYEFNNEDSPLFFQDYHHFFGTLHTVVYLPKSLEVIVGVGGNAEPTRFSLAKWLEGECKVGGHLIGKINIM